ncbi:MAG: hypothetical protein AB7U75_02770 [Hyphomicrobiaceae bacterium]
MAHNDDLSRYLAKLMGPTLLAMSAAMLVNRDAMQQIAAQIANDYAVIFLSGILLLVAGLAIVHVHNVWSGWPALVTALGWLAIVGGLIRMFLFQHASQIASKFVVAPATVLVAAGVMLAVGAFLTAKAYRLL